MLERLLSALKNATTADLLLGALDVLLVYYIIYRTLLLIKGTKAVQMLVGLLLVAVFFFASKPEYLGLGTLHWLLDRFMASFILVLVILFQDDIRRGLSQVGRSSPLSQTSRGEQTFYLEEIVKACQMMGERRIGALIVIEREAELTDHVVDGVPIDATVSKELLVAIFLPYKANPTHDGAVLVQDGRITSAACFLPLTTNPHVEKMLGTRHRAAIGLSELTDAVVVVVSEETGVISVAFQEELTRGLDATNLRALLQKLLSEPAPDIDSDRPGRPRRLISWLRPGRARPPQQDRAET